MRHKTAGFSVTRSTIIGGKASDGEGYLRWRVLERVISTGCESPGCIIVLNVIESCQICREYNSCATRLDRKPEAWQILAGG